LFEEFELFEGFEAHHIFTRLSAQREGRITLTTFLPAIVRSATAG
jgi:hypothetical protein